jgi:altronate dehydratase
MEDVDDNDDINKFVEVLIVSDKYGCLKLKDQVETLISTRLTNENVSGLLVISDRHNSNNLKRVCCAYIRQHYSEVKKTSQYREIRSEVENILNNEKKNTCAQNNKRKVKSNIDEENPQPSKKQKI